MSLYRRLCSKESAIFSGPAKVAVLSRGSNNYRYYSTIVDQRKPVLNGLLVEPETLQHIKEYRSAKEWHIFRARFEKPLLEAFEKFQQEADQQKLEDKKLKRRQRRDATLEYRRRHHLATLNQQAEWRDAFIKRPWDSGTQAMKDTLDWAALRNPFYGQIDSLDQDLSKFCKPETLLPLESWIFFNRTHWKDIPFLSNVFTPYSNHISFPVAESMPHHPDLFFGKDIDLEEDDDDSSATIKDNHEPGDELLEKQHVDLNAKTAKAVLDSIHLARSTTPRQTGWLAHEDLGHEEAEPPAPPQAIFRDLDLNVAAQASSSPQGPNSEADAALSSDGEWYVDTPAPRPDTRGVPQHARSPLGTDPHQFFDELKQEPLESGEYSSGPDETFFDKNRSDSEEVAQGQTYAEPNSDSDKARSLVQELVNNSDSEAPTATKVVQIVQTTLPEYLDNSPPSPDLIREQFRDIVDHVFETLSDLAKKPEGLRGDILYLQQQLQARYSNGDLSDLYRRQWSHLLLRKIQEEVEQELKLAPASSQLTTSKSQYVTSLLENKLVRYGLISPEESSFYQRASLVLLDSDEEPPQELEDETGLGHDSGDIDSRHEDFGEPILAQPTESSSEELSAISGAASGSEQLELTQSDLPAGSPFVDLGALNPEITASDEESPMDGDDDYRVNEAAEDLYDRLQIAHHLRKLDIIDTDPTQNIDPAENFPAFPRQYFNTLAAYNLIPHASLEQHLHIPSIPPLDFEKIKNGTAPVDQWLDASESEPEPEPVTPLDNSQLQLLYAQAKLLQQQIPSDEQLEKFFKVTSPDYVSNILKGAKRVGIADKHLDFLKLYAFSKLPAKEDIARIRAFLENHDEVTNFIVSVMQYQQARIGGSPDSDESTQNSRSVKANQKSKQYLDLVQMASSPEERELLTAIAEELPAPEPDLFDFDSTHDKLEVSESESDTEENEDLVTSTQTTKFYVEYALRLKQLLDEQMREQLVQFGLLGGEISDMELLSLDPPAVGKDVDPCVEIIHSSHIQSMTNYSSLEHAQRKVVFKIKIPYLEFPAEVEERLAQIVGPRYDRETGIFKFVADVHKNKHQNTIYGIRTIKKIFESAYEACPYYIPLSDLHRDPVETVADCPVPVKCLAMPTPPEIKEKPWIKEKRLKPPLPHFLFRTFPFGWSSKQHAQQ